MNTHILALVFIWGSAPVVQVVDPSLPWAACESARDKFAHLDAFRKVTAVCIPKEQWREEAPYPRRGSSAKK